MNTRTLAALGGALVMAAGRPHAQVAVWQRHHARGQIAKAGMDSMK